MNKIDTDSPLEAYNQWLDSYNTVAISYNTVW